MYMGLLGHITPTQIAEFSLRDCRLSAGLLFTFWSPVINIFAVSCSPLFRVPYLGTIYLFNKLALGLFAYGLSVLNYSNK